jgi:transposase-like protein
MKKGPSISVMENPEKPRCPECGSEGKRKGINDPTGYSPRQRYECKKCPHKWEEHLSPELKRFIPLNKLRPQDLIAIELYAAGYQLSYITQKTKVTHRTFKKRLMDIYKGNLWDELKNRLSSESPSFDEDGLEKLRLEIEKFSQDKMVFRRVGQIRAKEWRERPWEKQDLK